MAAVPIHWTPQLGKRAGWIAHLFTLPEEFRGEYRNQSLKEFVTATSGLLPHQVDEMEQRVQAEVTERNEKKSKCTFQRGHAGCSCNACQTGTFKYTVVAGKTGDC